MWAIRGFLLSSFIIFIFSGAARSEVSGSAEAVKQGLEYLDRRADHWMRVTGKRSDCISCHTVLPYVMARASIGALDHDNIRTIQTYVVDRVDHFADKSPWYDPEKSKGTESILNATILSFINQSEGRSDKALSRESKLAIELMLGEQQDGGDFEWLDAFELAPFESVGARYWGSALAALTLGTEQKGSDEALSKLRKHLRKTKAKEDLHEKLMLLWASTKMTDLLTAEEAASIQKEVLEAQRSDGGWDLRQMTRGGAGEGETDEGSDSYATAYAAYVLLMSGVEAKKLESAAQWLIDHQIKEDSTPYPDRQSAKGAFPGRSVNRKNSLNHMFMTDAGSAFAVMFLDSISTRRTR